MNYFWKGLTYSYSRNIGWQDRTLRTLAGMAAAFGAYYFSSSNLMYAVLLGILAVAQLGTVLSARCIICYFAGICTIDSRERKMLEAQNIKYEAK